MKEEEKLIYWVYNKMLWMFGGCIILLGVLIGTSFSILTLDKTTKITSFLFVIAFISLACYVWEKREFYGRQLQDN